jgi:anaerobic dimethyl sulfoxide reductase subunit A
MHPEDAAARSIVEGDLVNVFNYQGTSRVHVHLSDDIVRGVVCLPEGVWVELDADGVDTAGSANVLTETEGTVPSRSAIMHGVGVEVSRD